MKPMLAQPYEGQNPKGWLMSEKLDGVRAIWDGQKLVSRNGVKFSLKGTASIGDKITFSFCGLTNNSVPRFPSFVTVRNYE